MEKLTACGDTPGQEFSSSIAMEDGVVVAGSYGQGAAFVFEPKAPQKQCEAKKKENNKNQIALGVILGAVAAVCLCLGIGIFAMKRQRQSTKPPPVPAPAHPVHEPTAPPQPALASIKAEALGMMSEEPPQAAEPIAEAITMPHGHVSGAEAAAMMAEGEPPPQPSEGWGARTLQRLASWRAVEEPPPPPAAETYAPEAELEPEC